MPELRTIPLGGTDFAGNPLPAEGQFYVPGGPASATGEEQTGGWAPYQPPAQPQEITAQKNDATGGWAAYTPQEPKNPPQIGSGEAALRGAAHGLTFGFEPAIAGLASGVKAAATGGDFSSAYNETRQSEQEAQEAAGKQHPYIFTASDIAGNLPTLFVPGIGAGKAMVTAAESLPRIGQAIRAGAVAGGLFGAGEQTSKGASPLEIAEGAGGGAVAGGALGGVLGSGVEGVSRVGSRVASIVRGHRDPELEAQRLAAGALKSDEKQVQKIAGDKAAIQARKDAGLDVRNADLGGGNTKALLRAATNMSPEARDVVSDVVTPRFAQQGDRIGRFIRSQFGGIDSDIGKTAIKAEARRQNAPLYKAARDQADRLYPQGIWSDKLEQLLGSNAVPQALQTAISKGRDRAIAEGQGAFNPRVTFENGLLITNRRGGPPAYPDLQLWDYTQRALRDMASEAQRAGRHDEADALFDLHRQLLTELDSRIPAFAKARGTAAAFFKASDALEAGANFVKDTSISNAQAARVLASMKPAERELFKRGFAAELASRVERTGFNKDVLNSIFLNTPNAKQRILLALGPQDAGRLEALLRIEGIVDRTRKAMGNSTTTQQLGDVGKFGGTLAAIEGIKGAINPAYLLAAPLIWAGRQTGKQIDERVFTRVAELLMSDDPAVLARGLDIASKNPTVRTALRYASDLTARQLVNLLGPSGVAAGAGTLIEHFKGKPPETPGNHQSDYENYQLNPQTVP